MFGGGGGTGGGSGDDITLPLGPCCYMICRSRPCMTQSCVYVQRCSATTSISYLVFIEKCDIKITTKLGLSIVSFYIWIKAVEKFKGKFSLFLKIVLLLYIYLIICTSKYNNLMQPFMCAQLKMVK